MPRSRDSDQLEQADFRESSVVPDSQVDSDSDRDLEFDVQPPRPSPRPAKAQLRREVKDYVHRQFCKFRQWGRDYRFVRFFTRGPQELEAPLELNAIRPTVGDFWIHEVLTGNCSHASGSTTTYQYWVFKSSPVLFWKQVWPGIGDWRETHPHPGCQFIKLIWKEQSFQKKRIVLPVWRLDPKASQNRLSEGFSERAPLEIKKPATQTSFQEAWESVPESPETSDIEYCGSSHAYETKTPTSTASAEPASSLSGTPTPQPAGTLSPAPSNPWRLSQESLGPVSPPSFFHGSPPPSRIPLSAHRYLPFNRHSRTPTVDPPSRSPSILQGSIQESLRPPTPQPVGFLEWVMDILRRVF